MADRKTDEDRMNALRRRAQWYRHWAQICAGDNRVFLELAAYFERLAGERK